MQSLPDSGKSIGVIRKGEFLSRTIAFIGRDWLVLRCDTILKKIGERTYENYYGTQ